MRKGRPKPSSRTIADSWVGEGPFGSTNMWEWSIRLTCTWVDQISYWSTYLWVFFVILSNWCEILHKFDLFLSKFVDIRRLKAWQRLRSLWLGWEYISKENESRRRTERAWCQCCVWSTNSNTAPTKLMPQFGSLLIYVSSLINVRMNVGHVLQLLPHQQHSSFLKKIA